MLPRPTLILGGMMSFSPVAHAQEIRMTCNVIVDRSGESPQRSLVIDTNHASIRDNEMRWTNGAGSPLSDDTLELFQMGHATVSWDYRRKATGAEGPSFTVNLADGR